MKDSYGRVKLDDPLTDDELMPFGQKYKNIPMKDVPASYLLWAYENIKDLRQKEPRLYAYIWNNLHHLQDEIESDHGR